MASPFRPATELMVQTAFGSARMLRETGEHPALLREVAGRVRTLIADEDEEEWGGAVDPSSLLNVVEALAKLTHGLPIDPASGAILS